MHVIFWGKIPFRNRGKCPHRAWKIQNFLGGCPHIPLHWRLVAAKVTTLHNIMLDNYNLTAHPNSPLLPQNFDPSYVTGILYPKIQTSLLLNANIHNKMKTLL